MQGMLVTSWSLCRDEIWAELLMPNGDILFCKTFAVLRCTFVYVKWTIVASSSSIDVTLL